MFVVLSSFDFIVKRIGFNFFIIIQTIKTKIGIITTKIKLNFIFIKSDIISEPIRRHGARIIILKREPKPSWIFRTSLTERLRSVVVENLSSSA